MGPGIVCSNIGITASSVEQVLPGQTHIHLIKTCLKCDDIKIQSRDGAVTFQALQRDKPAHRVVEELKGDTICNTQGLKGSNIISEMK
jgi:hypothetical protein